MKINFKKTIALASLLLIFSACAQTKSDVVKDKASKQEVKVIPNKKKTLAMNKNTLDAKITGDIDKKVIEKKVKITAEALSTIKETENLLKLVDNKNKKEAVKKGKELIGSLELILAKDPTLATIPVNVDYVKEEFVNDIAVVRNITDMAKKAMKDGYYRVASDLLKDLRSEIIIKTYLIPTATYPSAISKALLLVDDKKFDKAKLVLENVLGTIIIEKTVLPLPVLNAEQMIIEASVIDAKDHENKDKVINLLKNADYQLQLAEELGYGKKDKDFKLLTKSITELKKLVNDKKNSKSKFSKLKEQIKLFKKKVLSNNK